jgi:lysophospholipase L1-like esterase
MVRPMRFLRQGRLRPSLAWLAAGALLLTAAIWAIPGAFSPTGASGLPHHPAPKAVATTTSTATPTTTMAPGSATVVGIGDSVTAASVCGCTGFVESYAANLPAAAGGPAHAVNLGANGLTAAGLRTLMTTPGPTTAGVAKADILLVTIGANDLTPLLSQWQASGCTATCYSPAVDAVGSNVAAILSAAKNLRDHRPTRVLVTDYWNVFADGDVARASDGPAYLRWSDELTRALNSRICTAARNAGATCVDLYMPFKGNGSLNPTALLAADGDHPNAAGNLLISAALMAATPQPSAGS